MLACSGTLIFQCWPVRAAWTFSIRATSHCFSNSTFSAIGLTNSSINCATDFLLAALPIPAGQQTHKDNPGPHSQPRLLRLCSRNSQSSETSQLLRRVRPTLAQRIQRLEHDRTLRWYNRSLTTSSTTTLRFNPRLDQRRSQPLLGFTRSNSQHQFIRIPSPQ